MARTARRDVPVSPRDARRIGLVLVGMGLLFLLGGFALLAFGDVAPWVLALCLLGWGIGAACRGIIHVLDGCRKSD